jgi:hypothetical protein
MTQYPKRQVPLILISLEVIDPSDKGPKVQPTTPRLT